MPLPSCEAMKTLLPAMPRRPGLMPQPTQPSVPERARNATSAVPFSGWYVQCRLAPSVGMLLHRPKVRPPLNVADRQSCAVAVGARSSTAAAERRNHAVWPGRAMAGRSAGAPGARVSLLFVL